MILVIGNESPQMNDFLNNIDPSAILINNICVLKHLKECCKVYIPFEHIQFNGNITNTSIIFEEMLLSLNIEIIYYYSNINEDLFIETCNYYKVNYKII